MVNFIFFSLGTNKVLVKELSTFGESELGEISINYFADREVLVKTLSNVENKDCVVIESTAYSAHETLFRLLLLLDSINRAGAKSVKLFIPYFGYSRQERVSWDNEPISCEVVAKILETAKYDKLYSFDLHHPVISEFFKRGIINLMPTPIFIDYYLNYFKKNNINIEDVVIISPDHGANNRADMLVKGLKGARLVILKKVRPKVDSAEHMIVDSFDINNKVCIIIDDIIDTGGTIVSAAKLLYESGAKSVLVGATHAVFSNNCYERLKEANIQDIVVTNTIEHTLPKGVQVIDILPIVLKHL